MGRCVIHGFHPWLFILDLFEVRVVFEGLGLVVVSVASGCARFGYSVFECGTPSGFVHKIPDPGVETPG